MSGTAHFFQHTDTDPTVRSYTAGEQACEDAVKLARSAPAVTVDIETNGLNVDAFTVKIVVIATPQRAAVLDATNPKHRRAAKEAISTARALLFHNAPYDVPPLVYNGMMSLSDLPKVTDTLVTARLRFTDETRSRGLSELEKIFLATRQRTAAKDRLTQWAKINGITKGESWRRARYDDPAYLMYAAWDGVLTAELLSILHIAARNHLTSHPFGRYGADPVQAEYLIEREQRVNRVMLGRSARGLSADPDQILAEQNRLLDVQLGLESTLTDLGLTKFTNRDKLADVLEKAGAFPAGYPRTPKTGRPSTAAENLETVEHPLAVTFRAYDHNQRLIGYLEKARAMATKLGRIYPQVNVLKASTGRMSYGDPALQQFTEQAREAILADPGETMVSLDWSQIEPVVAANLAGDTTALHEFEQGSGDLYRGVADVAEVSRKTAKVVVLAALYGQGTVKLAKQLGVGIVDAERVQARVRQAMPRTFRLAGWAAEWSRETGATWTLSGRIISEDTTGQFSYKGTNHLVQGSAYDLLAETLVGIEDAGLADALYLAMHDEVVVESSAALDIQKIMQTPPDRLVELAGRTPLLRTSMTPLGARWGTPK